MTFLLDTNVISASTPVRPERPQALIDWLDLMSEQLYLSVITATEIRDGIAKLEREGATRKASILKDWWDCVEQRYGDRILAFDLRAARVAGMLMDRARAAGLMPGFADVAIAATAETHGLTLLTRNTKDFVSFGGLISNPFESLPC